MRLLPALTLVTTALIFNPVHSATISGFVTDGAGNPVAGADLDVHISATGVKLVTPNDNTDAAGFYSINVLQPGVYDITYDSPAGTRLLGRRLYNVNVPTQGIEINVSLSSGMVISGHITNSSSQPVDSVNIDVDSLGGGRLYTSNDQSDATGAYWIVVPTGSYRLRFSPLPGSRLMGAELDTVLISKDTIIDLVLADGLLLGGIVSNTASLGIALVAIDLRDQVTGAKVFLANDKTSADGSYLVAAPTGLYVLRFTPPAGSRYVPEQFDSVQLATDRTWNQVLQDGVLATVIAQDSAGRPVAGVNVDFKLTSTGAKLYTPNDKTDSLGRIVAALVPNLYTVQLDPPLTLPFSLVKLDSIDIRIDTVITVTMPELPRILLVGRIIVAGSTPLDVKVDLRSSATGIKAVLNNNLADSLGLFSFPAPVGVYDLTLSPPPGSRIVGRIIPSIGLTRDTSVGDLTMQIGSLVRSKVLNRDGQPIGGIDLDFIEQSSGVTVPTPHDNTDGIGEALVAVLPGSYLVRLTPPAGSPYRQAQYPDVVITGDSTLQFVLARESDILPTGPFFLEQNYPNPFNGQTSIAYTILEATDVSIAVYNILGQLVIALVDRHHLPGSYSVVWDGRNRGGRESASGVYFARLETQQGSDAKKMLIIK